MSQRLFVGAWPPPPVVAALEALPRPEDPALRWTDAAQWHVTLAFIGEVGEASVDVLVRSLRAGLESGGAARAVLAPAAVVLGRTSLVLPASGLDDLAGLVSRAVTAAGLTVPDRPFRGHLTLARGRGRRPIPPSVRAVLPAALPWTVAEVDLVRSERRSDGAAYSTVASVRL